MGNLLFQQRTHGDERGEHGITVVGTTAPVQSVTLLHRLPRPQSRAPATHFRLFVEMAVQQHGMIGTAGDLHVQERRTSLQAYHFRRHAGNFLIHAPALDKGHGLLHVTMGLPVGIKGRGLVRYLDIVFEDRHGGFMPGGCHKGFDPGVIHFLSFNFVSNRGSCKELRQPGPARDIDPGSSTPDSHVMLDLS